MADLTIGGVLDLLQQAAPASKAAEWDRVGLQIGDPDRPARRTGVCHEVTSAVVEAVEAKPVDLLVTYHPLLFRPVTKLVAGAGPAGRALRLAAANVALAVMHSNFDAAPGGTADALASAIGLGETDPFAALPGTGGVKVVTFVPAGAADAVAGAMAAAGAGRIGNYRGCSFRSDGTGTFIAPEGTHPAAGRRGEFNREPEVRLEMVAPAPMAARVVAALAGAHPYEEPAFDVFERWGDAGFAGRISRRPYPATIGELADRVSVALEAPVRMTGGPDTPAGRVAVLAGSGADLIEEAGSAGAATFITGDVSHHQARAALDAGLAIIDPGHVPSERPGVRALLRAVASVLEEVVDLTGIDPEPWKAVRWRS